MMCLGVMFFLLAMAVGLVTITYIVIAIAAPENKKAQYILNFTKAIVISTIIIVLVIIVCYYAGNIITVYNSPYIAKLRSYTPERLRKYEYLSFYTDSGAYDCFRFPLVFPYSISCTDSLDFGTLRCSYPEHKWVLPDDDITHLAFDGKLLIAEVYSSYIESDSYWIIFNFNSGEMLKFDTKSKALKEAINKGFSGSQDLEDLTTHYDRTFK